MKIIPGLHGDVGVDNAGDARIIAPCAGVEGAHEPCKHGVDRHAHQNNAQRRKSALPGKGVHQQESDHPAYKREQGREKVEGGHKGSNEHRRQAGPGADADDAGVCQWVFHHSLQQHAGYSGCRSAEDGDEDAGKPQVVNGRHVFVVFNKESFEQLQGRYLQAAGVDGNQKQRQQPQSGDDKGKYFLFSAYHRIHSSFIGVWPSANDRQPGQRSRHAI